MHEITYEQAIELLKFISNQFISADNDLYNGLIVKEFFKDLQKSVNEINNQPAIDALEIK